MDGLMKMRMQTAPFIMKLLEVEQPQELMELNMPESRKVVRKQIASQENEDTMDRGYHHRPSVVVGSTFFCSSFLPQAWQPSGICVESKYTQLRSKQGQKGQKTYKIQKRIIPKHK